MLPLVFLILLLLLIAWLHNFIQREERRFEHQYEQFLNTHEGLEMFCYTNRERFFGVIESNVLPLLDGSVKIIKLVGKEPKTDLDERVISYLLNNIKNVGFPNVMKVVDGNVVDVSMHDEIYNCINNNKLLELSGIIRSKFEEVRSIAGN